MQQPANETYEPITEQELQEWEWCADRAIKGSSYPYYSGRDIKRLITEFKRLRDGRDWQEVACLNMEISKLQYQNEKLTQALQRIKAMATQPDQGDVWLEAELCLAEIEGRVVDATAQ